MFNIVSSFFKSARLLLQPGLKRYVVMPILVNILVFSLLIMAGVHGFSALIHHMLSLLPSWLYWLSWLLWFLFWTANLIFVGYCFVLVGNLVAAPFNGLLAAKVQAHLTGQPPADVDWQTLIISAFKRQLQLIAYYLPRLLLCLLLFVIPVLQLLAPLVWFCWGAWVMALQYFDYPADNNQRSVRELREYLSQKRFSHLSFGGVVLIASAIPLLNIFVMPLAVTAATSSWCDASQLKETS